MQWMEDCIQTTSLSPDAAGTQLEEEGDGVTPLPAYRQRPLTNDHSTMTKWPAWYSNIRIQRWGAKPEMDPRYRGYITHRTDGNTPLATRAVDPHHPGCTNRQNKHAKDTDAGT